MNLGYEESVDYGMFPLGAGDLERIETILQNDLINSGVHNAIVIDRAGNIVARQDNGKSHHDLYSFAALASANYAAVDTMAQIVGEKEFSLLFHKGKEESTHFSKINEEYLLITIFGPDMPLGLLRLKVGNIAEKIRKIWEH